MSAALDLGDPAAVLSVAERLDLGALPPGLHGRCGQSHLTSAWAHTRIGNDPMAVIHLLETERVAPELLANSRTAHDTVRALMTRERRHTLPALRGLALRSGALP